MNNVQLRYIFDRKKEANNSTKTGLLQIEVRISGTNKRKLISTGVHLYKNQFSATNGFTCKNRDNAMNITGKVRNMFRQVESFALSDKCKTLDDVRNWNKEPESYSVVDFMREELRKSNPTSATLEHHNTLIKRVEEFGKFKTFNDINFKNISDFDSFLRKTISAGSTLQKRHSTFRRYIKKAIYMDLCEKDPYTEFKMPSKKGKDPIFLTEDEIKLIEKYNPDFGYLERTRDLYLFQCYTGMAYADLMQFGKDSVFTEGDYKVIRSNRQKTDERYVSYFLPQAEAIADKYKYNLPKLTNQKYNEYLKVIAEGAGINKPLTSHSARHTFATFLLNKNVSIESVAGALGHSNIKQTQHYAKLLGRTIVKEMADKLVNKREK